MSASDPHVTVLSLESEGVALIPWTHPGLESGRAKEFDPILPYTVVIQNNTEEEIIAYSVVWKHSSKAADRTQEAARIVPRSTRIVALTCTPREEEYVKQLADRFSREPGHRDFT
jgi:hypothetical protein